jgi:hypothetical protein
MLAIVVITLSNVMLRYISKYDEMSDDLLHFWRNDHRLRPVFLMQFFGKRARAIRPIPLSMGLGTIDMIEIDRSLLCSYNVFWIEKTMAILIAYHEQ